MDDWTPESPDATQTYSPEPQHNKGYRGSIISHTLPPSTATATTTTFAMPRGVKKEQPAADPELLPEAPTPTEKALGKQPQADADADADADIASEPSAAVAEQPAPIVIKNHFPVARIKRIMQADDDVGKVAQVTPVVVSKALELFMISLVTKAAAEAKGRNSKRVAPAHLKQVVVKNEQFDFLSDIVSKVADIPAPAEKSDAMDVDGKKRKAPARKKKKVEEDF